MITSSNASSSKVASDIIHGADFLLDPTRETLQSRHGFHRPYTRGGGYSLTGHVETIRDETRVELPLYDSARLSFDPLVLQQTMKPVRVAVPGGYYERIKTPMASRYPHAHPLGLAARNSARASQTARLDARPRSKSDRAGRGAREPRRQGDGDGKGPAGAAPPAAGGESAAAGHDPR